MKTKVLTVLSATVASMRTSQTRDLADPPISTSAILVSNIPAHSPQLERQPQKPESPTCYELQEQWLLVKQKYNAWQPRCVAYPAANQQKLSRVRDTPSFQSDLPVDNFSWLEGQFPAFEWHLIESPAGSYSRLSNTDTLTPCIILDQPGQYRVRFVIDPQAKPPSDRQDTITVPAIVSELAITADESGIESVAIALADFSVKSTALPSDPEPCLFLVAVYAGLTYL